MPFHLLGTPALLLLPSLSAQTSPPERPPLPLLRQHLPLHPACPTPAHHVVLHCWSYCLEYSGSRSPTLCLSTRAELRGASPGIIRKYCLVHDCVSAWPGTAALVCASGTACFSTGLGCNVCSAAVSAPRSVSWKPLHVTSHFKYQQGLESRRRVL